MDKLKRGISLRGYAHENPIIAYKREGLDMFEAMTESIQEDTLKLLLKGEINNPPKRVSVSNDVTEGTASTNEPPRSATVVKGKRPGRNDACPCGSGLKYKNCCGKN
jgi:preprotein translocase subunit SecA